MKIFNEIGIEQLCTAVISRAVKDYYIALIQSSSGKINELEDFFLSDDFTFYCELDGNIFVKKVKYAVDHQDTNSWSTQQYYF